MKDKLFKVKRRHVDWYEAMWSAYIPSVIEHFWLLKTKHPQWSNNRVAYNSLKTYYSTTAMLRFRFTGSFS